MVLRGAVRWTIHWPGAVTFWILRLSLRQTSYLPLSNESESVNFPICQTIALRVLFQIIQNI